MTLPAKPWMTFANRKIVHECEVDCEECEGTGKCPECCGLGTIRGKVEEPKGEYEYPPSAAAFIKTMDELNEWRAFERAAK